MLEILFSLFRVGFLFFFLLDPDSLVIRECKENHHVLRSGAQCWAWIDDLRPSQFSVGLYEIQGSTEQIESLSNNDLRRLREYKPIPINISPRGELFMYNRHHSTLALYLSSLPASEKWMRVRVTNNWSYLENMEEFFRRLMAENHIRLFDAKGLGPLDPSLLPTHIKDLQNDPFRSLASLSKNHGCWSDTRKDIPFAEFYWADFFREKLYSKFQLYQTLHFDNHLWCEVRPSSPDCLKEERTLFSTLLRIALPDLCHSDEARKLPGFIKAPK